MKSKAAWLAVAIVCVSLGALSTARLQAQQSSFPTVQLPPGFRIEKVVDGLTYPTSLAWDNEGKMYVVEAGGQFLEEPPPARILRIEGNRVVEVVNLADKGIADSAVGITWHNGAFLITHREPSDRTGAVSRVTLTGTVTRLITGIIDSQSEHQVNAIRVGPDGRVYFASGPAANSAVVGIDNAPFVTRSPMVRTTPCVDYVLTGVNFATPDFRTPEPDDIAMTGGFVPFGTMTTSGQRIRGMNKCGGAILSFDLNNPEGSLRPYAHGFRNVIDMVWDSRGEMFAAVNGYDVRGSRPVNDQFDATYKVRENMWYGWPDFSAALEPVTDPKFDSPESLKAPVFIGSMAQTDKNLRFLIDHAASSLRVADRSLIAGLHEIGSSPSAMDIAPASMGTMAGQIFVAEWGDLAPGTNPLLNKTTGSQVVRIDPVSRRAVPFARNVRSGPASGQGAAGMGLERPFDVKFGPDGAMYIVDYGIARVNPARAASGQVPYEFPPRTGAIWKITGTPTNAPAITAVMAVNADFASPAVAPGSLIRIFGSNLAAGNADLSGFTGSTLPTTLNNVRVTIAGRPAPVLMVSPTGIVAQVPFETPRASQPVVVISGTAMSQSLDVLVTEVAPAVLFDEIGGFILKNSDFSRVRADNPARAGDILLLYSTGLGLNSSRLQTGALVARDARIDTQPVTVTIGGQPAEVIYSIASPGFAGLFQTAVRVPSGLPGATAPVVLRAGTAASNTVNLAIAGMSQ